VLIDESGFFLNPLVRRTLAPKGRTPVLEVFGRHRDKVSVVAAVTVSPVRRRLGLSFAADPDDYLGGDGVAAFVRVLLRHLRGQVVLVWDRGSNHKGEPIRRLLRDYERLSVEYLPAYAPELNPVEAVWSYVKYGRLPNYVPRDLDELHLAVLEHLYDTKYEPGLLRDLWDGSELPFPTRHLKPEGQ